MIRGMIPNTLTCCNLLCGCVAVVMALGGAFTWALMVIICGALFDFADGMVARLLNVSSPIGKELDSLADCVTFGVAPSSMIYAELAHCTPCWTAFLAFLMAAFSALRLAKFNLDARQTTSFIGLPTPANALFWASFLTTYGNWFYSKAWGSGILLVMMVVSCVLLVCEMPMFAMKFKTWAWKDEGNALKYSFVALSAIVCVVTLIVGEFFASFAIIVLAYILLSLIMWLKNK